MKQDLFRSYLKEGSSAEEEYALFRQHNGLIDGGDYAVLKVTGDGAVDYLDALATKDIRYLNIDTLAECLILNDDAQALGSVWIIRGDEDFYVVIPPESAEQVTAWMQAQKPDDVTLEDASAEKALVFIEGQQAWKIVRDVLKIDVTAIPFRGVQEIADWNGFGLLTARIGRTGEYGYLVFGLPDAVTAFVDGCFACAKENGMTLGFCGKEAEEVCMLETRQPNFRYENADAGNVFELCQQWLIQFEKEDYHGAERLKEIFAEPLAFESVGFACANRAEIPCGADITLDGEKVGTVVYAMFSPGRGAMLGIAKLKADLAVSGITLDVNAADGTHAIETLSSPFVRPVSWDEKME